ncbi:MAG: phage holin family protein [Oscillospiraceae bacterium]|nr:phage holin family protein [Oscillospiraceae bacterium]
MKIDIGKTGDIIIFTLGGIAGFLWGEMDSLFHALIAVVILDYISGVISAFYRKKLSSDIGFRGICKKILLFLIVSVAHIVDTVVLDGSSILRTATIFLFIANEGISLLENASELGVPVPNKLLNALQQLKLKSENTNDENEQEKPDKED